MKQRSALCGLIPVLFTFFITSSCSKADISGPEEDCSTRFTGEVISCETNRTVVYKFISGTDEENITIQGLLTSFAGPDAVVTVTGGTLSVIQSSVPGINDRIIKLEGTAKACTEIIITITWNSTKYDDTISGNWTVTNGEDAELAAPVESMYCEIRRAGK